MSTTQMIMMGGGVFVTLVMMILAFSGPSETKARSRRLGGIRERHGSGNGGSVDAQLRRAIAARPQLPTSGGASLLPNRAALTKRLAMTGKTWTPQQYLLVTIGIAVLVAIAVTLKGFPWKLGIGLGLLMGLAIPHMAVNMAIKKRLAEFNTRFPDGIELMVRGLRSGLPISETLGVVGTELPGPIGDEFRMVTDKIRIGKSMDEALQETAERLGTPEFQFFCITIAIQRETGGNLAETLANLADVLRKRSQMKLKIKAMSSEAKASAWIVGALPFIVFGMIYMMNPEYLEGFFIDERLIIAGIGGLVWMGIGVFIMAKMIDFEI